MKKIAVYDLDGTLYYQNSHIEVLKRYYKWSIIDILINKLWSYIFLQNYQDYINKIYDKIPKEYVSNFILEFRKELLIDIENKKSQGYRPVIISNAPFELIRAAANFLKIEFYKAEIGKKSEILKEIDFKELYVVTDNITDIDLILLSNKAKVYYTKKNICYFRKYLKNRKNIIYIYTGDENEVNKRVFTNNLFF